MQLPSLQEANTFCQQIRARTLIRALMPILPMDQHHTSILFTNDDTQAITGSKEGQVHSSAYLYRYQALFTGLVWDRLREQVYQMEDPISRTSLTRPYSVR